MSFDTLEIVRIAVEAGQAIMDVYESTEGIEVQTKSDDSPLTEADIAAHNTIVRGLASICLLYTSPSPRDATLSRMPSSA